MVSARVADVISPYRDGRNRKAWAGKIKRGARCVRTIVFCRCFRFVFYSGGKGWMFAPGKTMKAGVMLLRGG